ESDQKLFISNLNLQAAQKAMSSSAYKSAYDYSRKGILLLDVDNVQFWNEHYDLIYSLHLIAAESAYLTFEQKEMEQLLIVTNVHAKNVIDKIKIYEIKIQSAIMQHNFVQAVDLCLEILNILGFKYSLRPSKLQILYYYLKTKFIFNKRSESYFLNLPINENEEIRAAFRIMLRMGSCSYHVNSKIAAMNAFKRLFCILKNGNSPESIQGFSAIGLIFCGAFNDYEIGYRFSQISLKLNEKIGQKNINHFTLFVYYTFIIHWKEKIHKSLDGMLNGYKLALDCGDFEYASIFLMVRSYSSLYSGYKIEILLKDIKSYLKTQNKLKQRSAYLITKQFYIICECLAYENNNIKNIISELENNKTKDEFKKTNNNTGLGALYICKQFLFFLLCDYKKSIEYAKNVKKYQDGIRSTFHIVITNFLESLSKCAYYNEISNIFEKLKILNSIKNNQKKLKRWSEHSPSNNLHRWY
ncbi:MAG: hypothetical protein HQK51_06435, partial [Oligoflexia bacterium]|nr:hypothetical protein [Oligoflexia bacterium]